SGDRRETSLETSIVARRARRITAMLDAESAELHCALRKTSADRSWIRTSARLPSRRPCRRGLCRELPRAAADLVGRHARAVPPEAQQAPAGVGHGPPPARPGRVAPEASPAGAWPPGRAV